MKFFVSLTLTAFAAGISHAGWFVEYLDGTNSLDAIDSYGPITTGTITPIGDTTASLADKFGSIKFIPPAYSDRYWLTVTPTEQMLPGLTAPTANSYSLSLAAQQGSLMNLTSISFTMSSASDNVSRAAPTFGFALWYEDGNGTWQKIDEQFNQSYPAFGTSPNKDFRFDLSGIAALQNVPSVNFAITALSDVIDPVGNKYAVMFSNITITGEEVEPAPIPEPATATLGMAALALLALRRRKR